MAFVPEPLGFDPVRAIAYENGQVVRVYCCCGEVLENVVWAGEEYWHCYKCDYAVQMPNPVLTDYGSE